MRPNRPGTGEDIMKNNMRQIKRVMAMVLTFCMMLGSMSGYVPGWFAVLAEEGTAEPATTPTEPTVGGGGGGELGTGGPAARRRIRRAL